MERLHLLAAPFLWIDRRVQRIFDAIFHVFMRRGVAKRVLRRNLWGLFIVTNLGDLMLLPGAWKDPGQWVLTIATSVVVMFLWYGRMAMDDRHDESVENRPAVLSVADARANGLKYLGWLIVVFAAIPPYRSNPVNTVLNATAALSMLALGYLGMTKPPAPKPKEPAAAALAKPVAA
jgi:hypothetical protein